MIKKQTISILAVVLVVMTLIAAYPVIMQRLPQKQPSVFPSTLVESDIIQISIEDSDGQLFLKPDNGQWLVNDYQANQSQVDRLVQGIMSASIDSIVSRNPEHHHRFGLGDDQVTKVTINYLQSEVSALIGNSGPQFNTVYISYPEQNEVYLVNSNLANSAQQNVNSFRDKSIASVDQNLIRRIDITQHGRTQSYEQNEEGLWVFGPSQEEVEESLITAAFNTLSSLSAQDFLEDEDQINDFDQSTQKIDYQIFSSGDNLLFKANILENENNYTLKPEDSDFYYLISKYSGDSLLFNPQADPVDALPPDFDFSQFN